jgi:hypothetical protein
MKRERSFVADGATKPSRSRSIAGLAFAGALVLADPCAIVARPGVVGVAIAAAAELSRDAGLQTKIAAVASAATAEQRTTALAALRTAAAPELADLVPQLALFLLDADGERAGMTPALIVSRLGITHGQILRAIERHLDTPDVALRAQLENLLGQVELGDVRALLAERGAAAPSPGLVRYLYARSAADAVTVLGAAPAAGTLPSQVIVVEDARTAIAAGRASDADRARASAALGALARDRDWRLRAYAAAAGRAQDGVLAIGDRMLSSLANDADPRVRAVARTTTTR